MSQRNRLTWFTDLDWAEIPKLIKLEFDFLVSDYSFKASIEDHINVISYSAIYQREKVAIKPVVDRKDGFAYVQLIGSKNGVLPQGWKIYDQGDLIFVRLFQACLYRKVPSPKADLNSQLSPKDQLRVLLRAEATTLKEQFTDILQDSDLLFVEMNEQWCQNEITRAKADFFSSAEILFKNKQYAKFLTHFKKCTYELTPLWEKRLAYAQKRQKRSGTV